jgi:hypothetical protein
MTARPMAATNLRLTPAEVGRLPLYVQEELYRLNLRLEECVRANRRLRGKTPEDFKIATVAMDLSDRQELPLDGAVRWQFGRKWSNSIDVRRGLIDRRSIKVRGIDGSLVVCPEASNSITIRLEDR